MWNSLKELGLKSRIGRKNNTVIQVTLRFLKNLNFFLIVSTNYFEIDVENIRNDTKAVWFSIFAM